MMLPLSLPAEFTVTSFVLSNHAVGITCVVSEHSAMSQAVPCSVTVFLFVRAVHSYDSVKAAGCTPIVSYPYV